jgi:hypothetical protein
MELKAIKDESNGRWTIEGLEPCEKTYERMLQMLKDFVPFKFARYGDGEFFCMSGKIGRNCDKHEYFPDLGQALNEAWYSSPEYIVGVQPMSIRSGLYQKVKEAGPKNIVNADVLHNASIDGKLIQLVNACNERSTILVGPKHLEGMRATQIVIPDVNCWETYVETASLIQKCLDITSNPVFLLCASMMSEVIIHDFKDTDATFIDCGSVFSPYFGVKNRSYHHKLKI